MEKLFQKGDWIVRLNHVGITSQLLSWFSNQKPIGEIV